MASRWLPGSIAAASAAALLTLGTSTGVWAQAAPAAPAAPDSLWVKICQPAPSNGKELCVITQEIRAETGQFIAGATLRQVTGEDKISLVAAVPLGMRLQAGVQVRIDEQAPRELKYGICFPNACFGELVVDRAFIDAMKKGGTLVIATLTQDGKTATFPMTLKGFTKSWDGPGLDPQGGQQVQNKLNEVLQQRAEQARQKLIEQQNAAGK